MIEYYNKFIIVIELRYIGGGNEVRLYIIIE